MFQQLALIGCGLMGGSFALALKRAGLVGRVVGYSRSPASSQRALELGVIDAQAVSAEQAVAGADIVLIAVPVAATESTLASIRGQVTSDMLVMDVGSTKGDVVQAAERALGERIGSFVPAHPITGKEVAGVEHADAELYQGRHVILTPLATTQAAQLQSAREAWAAVGGKLVHMAPDAHDTTFAAVSHLPHLLAFAMVQGIAAQPGGEKILALGGPGFRDFTRIAAADPTMWRDIFLANKTELLAQLRWHQQALQAMEQSILHDDGPTLERQIAQASSIRARWRMASITQDD
ncbi:prephenate dehydrogenase/arogenate dehydrogenase family protein [Pseudorhodoferax sp. Leaf267]|uniref:prephenate dehydrogenase n=1 Tax=Pseudorhodoferax sp. Leaf267 TaxID=1736316 RepID=UPI0006F271D9|nr:prephenate dehydrogenase/arogenate dehydrogenase family protein [Pseudorhodoferax sp. Leaf267]KQP17862.1 prephenate dehydrogenase [Pseudorhodoferax sp. Leaf267]